MIESRILFRFLAVFTLVSAPAAADDLTIDRLLGMTYPHEVATDPTSGTAALLLARSDKSQDSWVYRIVLTDDSSDAVIKAYDGPARDLQWSDGRLFFIADTSGSPQLWSYDRVTSELSQVTDLPVPVLAYRIAPNGRDIGLALRTHPECATLACSADRKRAAASTPPKPRAFTDVPIYIYNRFLDGGAIAPFRIDWARDDQPVRNAAPIIAKDRHLSMCANAGGHRLRNQFAFVRDGIVVCLQDTRATATMLQPGGLWLFPNDGRDNGDSGRAIGAGFSPIAAPDGDTFAYLSHDTDQYADPGEQILVARADGSVIKTIRPPDGQLANEIAFAGAGDRLVIRYQDAMHVRLGLVDIASGRTRPLTGDGTVEAFSANAEEVTFAHSRITQPHSVQRLSLAEPTQPPQPVWTMPEESELSLGVSHHFAFAGAGGETVEGAVVLPPKADPDAKLPVILFIHGGPSLTFGDRWHPRLNLQLYAAHGFAVVAIDPHGSSGYGLEFARSVHGDWGGKPLVDLRAGLAEASRRWPQLDLDRACAYGQSYGGFMVNWIASQWSDGFNCLINHAGIMDTRTFVFEMDIIAYVDQSMGGRTWHDAEALERFNPIAHVEHWRTPMLILHGMQDYRVPWQQGHAAFMALRRQNIPAEFILYKDEGHAILRPQNTRHWMEQTLSWMEKWTR